MILVVCIDMLLMEIDFRPFRMAFFALSLFIHMVRCSLSMCVCARRFTMRIHSGVVSNNK